MLLNLVLLALFEFVFIFVFVAKGRFGSLKSAQKIAQKVNLLKKALKKALKKVNLLKKGLKKEQPVKKVNSRKCIHSKK